MQAILNAASTGESIRLVPVEAIRGVGKKSRSGSVSFSRTLGRMADRDLVTLCRLQVAGPGERVTHILLTDAGRAHAAVQHPQPINAPAPEQPATRPGLVPAVQAPALPSAPMERPRFVGSPATTQDRRCPRCLRPISPDDPHCRYCFPSFRNSPLR
jgi:hypothetical protein